MKVHVLLSSVDYENCTSIIKVFESEADAQELREKILEYEKTNPLRQEDLEIDERFDLWDKWREEHPAGRSNGERDNYWIESWEVTPGSHE